MDKHIPSEIVWDKASCTIFTDDRIIDRSKDLKKFRDQAQSSLLRNADVIKHSEIWKEFLNRTKISSIMAKNIQRIKCINRFIEWTCFTDNAGDRVLLLDDDIVILKDIQYALNYELVGVGQGILNAVSNEHIECRLAEKLLNHKFTSIKKYSPSYNAGSVVMSYDERLFSYVKGLCISERLQKQLKRKESIDTSIASKGLWLIDEKYWTYYATMRQETDNCLVEFSPKKWLQFGFKKLDYLNLKKYAGLELLHYYILKRAKDIFGENEFAYVEKVIKKIQIEEWSLTPDEEEDF